ncbi:MAG: ATP-binding protein [Candidatus Dojkabacteria bacterium]|nr:ATP-binding protein [Candidatus Dojkabacteria bacterium]
MDKIQLEVEVESEQIRVTESIKNIIDNAIKYSPEKTKVEIKLEKLGNERIRISVKDQGIGIPEDQQDHIFQKFYRATNVLTENFDGTGLGLYYVKKSIEDLGGKVYFESQVNNGSTFYIELPLTYK